MLRLRKKNSQLQQPEKNASFYIKMFHLLFLNTVFIQGFSKGKFSQTGLIPGKLELQTHWLLMLRNYPDHHLFHSAFEPLLAYTLNLEILTQKVTFPNHSLNPASMSASTLIFHTFSCYNHNISLKFFMMSSSCLLITKGWHRRGNRRHGNPPCCTNIAWEDTGTARSLFAQSKKKT